MDSLVLVVSEKKASLKGLRLLGKRKYPQTVNEDNQEAS
jgi:hypothetical protein